MLRPELALSPPDSQTFSAGAGHEQHWCPDCIGTVQIVAHFRPAPAKGAHLRKLRVVLAEDNSAFFEYLRSVLSSEFDVVATASDGQSALETIRRIRPDVVVIDLAMPLLNGIEVTKELAKSSPQLPVVICSVESDPEIVQAATLAGASAYVHKLRIKNDLISAVRVAWEGKSFVSPLPS